MFKIAGGRTGHERTRGRRPVSYNCFIMAIAKGERRMLFFVGITENGRDGYVVYSFSYCSLTYLVLGTNMAIKFDLPKSWCLKPFNYYQNLFILWTCRTIHCVEMAYLHWSKHKRTIGCIVCLEHHCR